MSVLKQTNKFYMVYNTVYYDQMKCLFSFLVLIIYLASSVTEPLTNSEGDF